MATVQQDQDEAVRTDDGYFVVTIGVNQNWSAYLPPRSSSEATPAAKNIALLCKGRKVSEVTSLPGIECDTERKSDDEYLGMHKIKGATVEFYDGEQTDVDSS